MIGEIPPQSLEAERACLGASLTNVFAAWECAGTLKPGDFMRPEHAVIFRAIMRLADNDEPRVDPITVAAELETGGLLDRCGGHDYLRKLATQYGDLPDGVEHHARIVLDKARKRRLIEAGGKISQLGWDAELEPEDAEGQAADLLAGVAVEAPEEGITAAQWVAEEREALNLGKPVTNVVVPWSELRTRVMLAPQAITVVGGLTSHGKTVLMLNLAWWNVFEGRRVYFWVGEQGRRQIYARLVSLITTIPLQRITERNLNAVEWEQCREAAQRIDGSGLTIQDRRGMHLREIEADIRRAIKKKGPIDLGIIDYLQITGDLNSEVDDDSRRDVRVGRCVWRCGQMAQRLNCHIMIGSQFSGQPNSRFTSRPRISDLRDSRQIEQHADNVWLVYNPERDDNLQPEDQERLKGRVELIVGKQRQGQVGSVWLRFRGAIQTFDNLDRHDWPAPTEKKGRGKGRDRP